MIYVSCFIIYSQSFHLSNFHKLNLQLPHNADIIYKKQCAFNLLMGDLSWTNTNDTTLESLLVAYILISQRTYQWYCYCSKRTRYKCLFFLGTQTKDFFEDMLGGTHKDSFDYQFNTIHDYSLMGGLDGLIINYGTLGLQLKMRLLRNLPANSIPFLPCSLRRSSMRITAILWSVTTDRASSWSWSIWSRNTIVRKYFL